MLVFADDLSGAAETAAVVRAPGRATRIALAPHTPRHHPDETARSAQSGSGTTRQTLVVDLDTRHASAGDAARALTRAAREHATAETDTLPLAKIDSLLRGNVAATVAALRDPNLPGCPRGPRTTGAPTVLAPALPNGGRTVLGGVTHLWDTPLHHSDAWAAESDDPPTSIAAAISPAPSRTLPLSVVRSGRLLAALTDATNAGEIPICDAEEDTDLDTIVAAAVRLPGVRMVGSGGLAAALGRALSPSRPGTTTPPQSRHPITPDRPLLVVVGSAQPTAAEQLGRLRETGVRSVTLDVSDPNVTDARTEEVERLVTALGQGPTALSVAATNGVDPRHSRAIARRLATTAARALTRRDHTTAGAAGSAADLVLTGGETARRVLDALGVTHLAPVAEIHHGAVHSHTPDGGSVVTRPGGFGPADSLVRIVEHLRPRPASAANPRPGTVGCPDTDPRKG
ncbi:four-carbon acid sugar kinase family protein [Halostreptopolyspora alba]|uniref:Four-carbon acid sugar kinase family protein n=1 Tax=Halostreptopolyspora alba TaxID=2487137 RepID=A0A3N0E8T5_9ACTN|nr:four-carbon acid sugar kinase family protein [Nocardiopsaceae bacterium YIM 96095]